MVASNLEGVVPLIANPPTANSITMQSRLARKDRKQCFGGLAVCVKNLQTCPILCKHEMLKFYLTIMKHMSETVFWS